MLNKCKMVVFSDLHYAPEQSLNKIENKLIKFSMPILEKITNKINDEIKPDVVINLGDMISDFNEHDKDAESLKFVWNEFNKINPRFYSVIGNHDFRSMKSIKEVEQIMGYENSTFSTDINGYHLIFLGIGMTKTIEIAEGRTGQTQFLLEEDMQWIKNDLENNKLPCLIFLHYGVAEDNMEGNECFVDCAECALLGNRKELKEILKKDKNVIAVFSGHQHWTKQILEDNINYYVVGSLTDRSSNEEIPDGVYLEIELEGKKIDVKEKHIKLDIKKTEE